jgi:hypothetical protein
MKDMTSNWSQCLGSLLRATGAGVIALSLVASGSALAGIASTKHNLSTTGTAGNVRMTAGTADICVFCHTPHAANLTVAAPLWNKTNSGQTYTTYNTASSTTIDGSVLAVGSVSLACLSCHDGTQAMDNIINAPGSGGLDGTGGGAGGRTAIGATTIVWDPAQSARVSAAGNMLSGTVAMLGIDLTNDHPIGIQYCGGGQTTGAPAGACVDTDFVAPSNATINGQPVWWVNTAGGTAGRNKSDMILYTRTFTGGTGPSVECASCHDPHVEAGTGTVAAGATFLRVSNDGSAVCRACHNK